jgi:hypothetical protein
MKFKVIGKNNRVKLIITYYERFHKLLSVKYEYDSGYVLRLDIFRRRLEFRIEEEWK